MAMWGEPAATQPAMLGLPGGGRRGGLAAKHVPVRGFEAITQGLASSGAWPRVPGHPVPHTGSVWPHAAQHPGNRWLLAPAQRKMRHCGMRLSLAVLFPSWMSALALGVPARNRATGAPSCCDRLGFGLCIWDLGQTSVQREKTCGY